MRRIIEWFAREVSSHKASTHAITVQKSIGSEVYFHKTYAVSSRFFILMVLKFLFITCAASYGATRAREEGALIGEYTGRLVWRVYPEYGFDKEDNRWICFCRFSVVTETPLGIEDNVYAS